MKTDIFRNFFYNRFFIIYAINDIWNIDIYFLKKIVIKMNLIWCIFRCVFNRVNLYLICRNFIYSRNTVCPFRFLRIEDTLNLILMSSKLIWAVIEVLN